MCDFGVSFFPLERNVILSPVQCQTIILHKTKKNKKEQRKARPMFNLEQRPEARFKNLLGAEEYVRFGSTEIATTPIDTSHWLRSWLSFPRFSIRFHP